MKYLSIKSNNKEIYKTNNLQDLYLYPLTLKNYVENIYLNKPILLNIIEYDYKINYDKLLNHSYFNNLKCIELLIKDIKDIRIISKIINICIKKNILITLNIKDINIISKYFINKYKKYIKFFKIFWDYSNQNDLFNKLKIINKKNDQFILIKSYLNLDYIVKYETFIKNFAILNIDKFQVSKKLIEYNQENILLDDSIEKEIRKLENKYKIFVSVRNLKELYYPRFEIESRNSRNCISCKLKPYLYKDYLLPCKVNEMISNYKVKGTNDLNDVSKFSDCGKYCSDCASLYENDILNEIKEVLDKLKTNIEIEVG